MITVVGSVNVDFVVNMPRFPRVGETVIGTGFATHFGGKGANQAVAAARAGGHVAMVGRVGDDEYGRGALAMLEHEGIDVTHVGVDLRRSTGSAFIHVDASGANSICVVPGANGALVPDLLPREVFGRDGIVVLQGELPGNTVTAAARAAKRAGAYVVLNHAPVVALGARAYEYVDILVVNEDEASTILDQSPESVKARPEEAAALLADRAPVAVLTLGAAGVAWSGARGSGLHQGIRVPTVDTTGAGDAFVGNLTVALALGQSLPRALLWANYAGALTVTRAGATTSLPTRTEVAELIQQSPEVRLGLGEVLSGQGAAGGDTPLTSRDG